ncbi:pentapeptide repeat-containing protein [Streptosporangium sandarakinum]
MVPPQLRTPRPAAWWIVPVTLLVGGVVGGVAWLLLGAGWSVAEATARQGAIQTALAAGAGVGAAVTLMLTFRRQRHQEHAAHVTAYLAERNAALAEQVAEHTRHDATERRVTDLYTKAVEQLGHEAAAVRLGGLYALERLAQGNPDHRQTIVNVICAYLRMPYTPPEPASVPDPERDRKAALQAARRRYQAARAGVALPAEPVLRQRSGDQEGELQVRLTAQRILATHLRDDRPPGQCSTLPTPPAFWEGMRLDLTGATLIDFSLVRGHVTDAVLDKATFHGAARFDNAVFHGPARFDKGTFHEDARFGEATFLGDAWFGRATFHGPALFGEATFYREAWFSEALFHEPARFGRTTFYEDAWFGEVIFHEPALFGRATFHRAVQFGEAIFHGSARFGRANLNKGSWFDKAALAGVFDRVVVVDPAAAHAWPDG